MFGNKLLQAVTSRGTLTYQLSPTPVGAWKLWRTCPLFTSPAQVGYYAESDDGTIWEFGYGTFTQSTPDTITRNYILSSTGSLIDWQDGDAPIYIASVPLAEAMAGRYDGTNGFFVPRNRRPSTAVGAANKTIADADVAGKFTLDNSAAGRSVNLPAISAVGMGFTFSFMGTSYASLISLVPSGTDAIDYSSGGTAVKLPGRTWIDVWHDGSQWRTNYSYGQRTKLLEFSPSAASSVDSGGSVIPAWVNTLSIEFALTVTTDGAVLLLQLYDSGGSLKSGASDYTNSNWQWSSSPASGVAAATSTSGTIATGIDNSAAVGVLGQLECVNVQATAPTRPGFRGSFQWLDSGGALTLAQVDTFYANWNGPFTGFKTFPNGGTVSGAVRAYGST